MSSASGAARLLTVAGLPLRPDLLGGARAYLRLTRLGRWCGVITGLLVSNSPLAGSSRWDLTLPLLIGGYLLGDIAGVLALARAQRRGHRVRHSPGRAAALGVRDLLPAWARLAPGVALVPALSCTLLALVPRPHAISRASPSYHCRANVSWPTAPELVTVSSVALAVLIITGLAIMGLSRTPRSSADPAAARLDLVLRGMSARAIAGGVTALGLSLTAGVGAAIYGDLEVTHLCPATPGADWAAFPWAATVTPWLQQASLGLMIVSLLIWGLSSRSQAQRQLLTKPG